MKKKKKKKTTTKPKQAQILVIPDVCLFSKSAIGFFSTILNVVQIQILNGFFIRLFFLSFSNYNFGWLFIGE